MPFSRSYRFVGVFKTIILFCSFVSLGACGESKDDAVNAGSGLEGQVKSALSSQGNKRSFKPDELDMKTWKEALKDFQWEVTVEITPENSDKAQVLTSLTTAFQTIASLAGRPMTPNEQMIFNRILSESGAVSPLQLSNISNQPQPPMPTASPPVAALPVAQ